MQYPLLQAPRLHVLWLLSVAVCSLVVLPNFAASHPLELKKTSLLSKTVRTTAAFSCSLVTDLNCGVSVDSSTVGLNSAVDTYGCVGFLENGGEAVYRFELTTRQQVTLSLFGMSEDLDLFLLSDCNSSACIRSSTTVASEEIIECLDAGIYYVVVDGWNGASSNFTLDYQCAPCTPCTPQIVHDTCAFAELVPDRSTRWSSQGSTCCATDVTQAASCTGFSTLGKDVFYRLDMSPGCTATITVSDGVDGVPLDLSLYMITSCADAEGSCVAGSDAQVVGPETLTYQSAAGGTFYITVDSFADNSCGDYYIEVVLTGCGTVAVSERPWGQVKQLYR